MEESSRVRAALPRLILSCDADGVMGDRYTPPFDRHDWVVDRCGIKMRYVIDFYTGRASSDPNASVSFFLDVRPALDNWEGVKMRAGRAWQDWFGPASSS